MKTKLPTISIKGRPYVMVKDKVVAFNSENPSGAIITEIVKNDEKSVVVKATVYPDSKNQERRFLGHSEAYREGQMGDVPVEVAETSAIGRALSAMGYGVLESYASADEIQKANRFGAHAATMKAKPISPAQKKLIQDLQIFHKEQLTEEEIDKLDSWQASRKINELKNRPIPEKSNSQDKAENDWEYDLNDEKQRDEINAEITK